MDAISKYDTFAQDSDHHVGRVVDNDKVSNVKVSGSGRMQVCYACLA